MTISVVPAAVLDIASLVTLPELSNIELGQPFFQNGLLKLNITWDKTKGSINSLFEPPVTQY